MNSRLQTPEHGWSRPPEDGAVFDYLIIGSGAGGGTVAHALRETGRRIAVIERGLPLTVDMPLQDADALFRSNRFNAPEEWIFNGGEPVHPRQYYCLGGNTKFYGAVHIRMREHDFDAFELEDGVSPAWPISYADFEPWYSRAEALYGTHGRQQADPTEPFRSSPYPHSPISHEPAVQRFVTRLEESGYRPFPIPLALDRHEPGAAPGRCIRCDACDGYACPYGAKGDSQTVCLEPAAASGDVELFTGTKAIRLETGRDGDRIEGVVLETADGREITVHAETVILSAGTLNSALLLLDSASSRHPRGLANSSGQVGRNLMFHNMCVIVGVDPLRKLDGPFKKTFAVHDYYGDGRDEQALGSIQTLGTISADLFRAFQPHLPAALARWLERHSLPLAAIGEDLPRQENRIVRGPDGRPHVQRIFTNLGRFELLKKQTRKLLRAGGAWLQAERTTTLDATGHQCGSLRFGTDAATSVLDSYCRTHDVENLYVVDGSFFPSSSAVNPSLTILANALRVGAHLAAQAD